MRGLSVVVALAVSLFVAPQLRAAPTSVDPEQQLDAEPSTPVDATAQVDAPRLDGTRGSMDQVTSRPERSTETTRRWYGAETLGCDVMAVGLGVGGVAFDSQGMTTGGLAGYLVGAPLVHWAEGHPAKALASLGLRWGAPALAVAGYLSARNGRAAEPWKELTAVAGGTMLAVMAVDSSLLAWEDVPGPRPSSAYAASVTISDSLVAAGLAGVF